MKTKQLQKAALIKAFRQRASKNDTPELQEKRNNFISWLVTNNFNPNIKFWEMYPATETIKGKKGEQYFSKYVNTRTPTLSETRVEIDKLPFEKAFDIILEIIKLLMAKKRHFAVFYAEGQRSPHIIIYDFEQLKTELKTKRERYLAQLQFWKSVCPFFMQWVDYSVFHNDHPVPLEFAPHWKYGIPFNLVMEWLPENPIEKTKPTPKRKPLEKNEDEKVLYKNCCGRSMFLLKHKNPTTKIICCAICGKQEETLCKN